MNNSIETAVANAFFGTIAIDIAIDAICYLYCNLPSIAIDISKGVFQLLLLLRQTKNYCS